MPIKPETALATLGRDHAPLDASGHTTVNPPVWHGSTVLFPTLEAMESAGAASPWSQYRYGRYGLPTQRALEQAVASLEGGWRSIAMPSGVSALTAPMLGLTVGKRHALLVDCCYGPARLFAERMLTRMGVEVEYFPPGIGAGIAGLLRPDTGFILAETPGSLTFEMQDIPAIAAAAKAAGVPLIVDNTWASTLYCQPIALGADISVQAATKYIVGHSDAMLGIITVTEAVFPAVWQAVATLGFAVGPDDCNLALRGLRTLAVRLDRHQQTALALAAWLRTRPEVERLLYPALPEDPGHAIWQRDFRGASGLFGVVLRPVPKQAVAAMLDGLKLLGMGFSWGGFESLIVPTFGGPHRSFDPWPKDSVLLRIHAGLEHPADLIADLDAGFARMAAAAG